jgi:hypothetical protein
MMDGIVQFCLDRHCCSLHQFSLRTPVAPLVPSNRGYFLPFSRVCRLCHKHRKRLRAEGPLSGSALSARLPSVSPLIETL